MSVLQQAVPNPRIEPLQLFDQFSYRPSIDFLFPDIARQRVQQRRDVNNSHDVASRF